MPIIALWGVILGSVPNLGLFALPGFFLILFSFGVLMVEFFGRKARWANMELSVLAVSSFALLSYSGLYYGGLYQNKGSFLPYYFVFYIYLFFLYLSIRSSISRKFVFAATAAVYLVGALLTIAFSPNPVCDCFTTVRDSAQFFLKGVNPYSSVFSPVYGTFRPDYFPHLPFSFIFVSPFMLAFGDPRFSTLIVSLGSAFLLYRLFYPKIKNNMLNVLIASYLFLPRSFFMLEHMYQEINMFFFFLLFLYLLERKKANWAFFAFGLFFSFKHHVLLFLPVLLLSHEFRSLLRKNLAYFLAPFIIPLIYFFIDPGSFMRNILFFTNMNSFSRVLPIDRSLSLPTFLHQMTGISLASAQTSAAVLFGILYIAILKFIRNPYEALIAVLFAVHLTLSYSFFNHYYLLLLFLLFYIQASALKVKLPFETDRLHLKTR